MALHVVIGPPASGKSTFIRQHAQPGDIRIDYDALANTLAGLEPGNHEHSQAAKQVTIAARRAAIAAAMKQADTVDVWIIHSTPSASTLDSYREAGAKIHTIDPGRDVVMRRIKAERPAHMHAVAAKWYASVSAPKPRRTTTQRGLGWAHEQQRARLLAAHVDGSPCWWCAKPMWRDKTRNPDGEALAADHSVARAHGGVHADRLLHGRCNKSRGDGSRDHLRPALAREASPPAAPGRAPVFDWG